jgi:hypothetical protein
MQLAAWQHHGLSDSWQCDSWGLTRTCHDYVNNISGNRFTARQFESWQFDSW